jgi:hypothetical protein
MKKIITLVGTSLFENFFKNNPDNANLNRYNELKKTENSPYDLWNHQQSRIGLIQKNFTEQDMVSSAEISSIQSIQKQLEEEGISKDKISVHLIATDTILSVLAAQIIKPRLESLGIITQFEQPQFPFNNQSESKYVIKDLRISSQDEFQRGMMNLLSVLSGITDSNTIVNITGGYKAVVPILTIWAQLTKITKKEVKVKYLFNESEISGALEPLTIGELPVSLDWEVVEALKPILSDHILHKLNSIAPLLEAKKIKYSNNRFKAVNEADEDTKKILHKIDEAKHHAVNALTNFQLIRTESGEFNLTPIGKIIKENTNVGNEKGLVIEHLFFKYFYHQENQKLFDSYSVCKPIQDLPKAFIYKNNSIQIYREYQNGLIEIGDCDVALTKENQKTFVWVESKAYASASGLNDSYYNQLKARAIAAIKAKQGYEKVEILFLVYRFIFENLNDDPFLNYEKFQNQLKRLQEINSDPEVSDFTNFRCVGVTIPLKFEGDKINFDPFHKAEFTKWKFEELKV